MACIFLLASLNLHLRMHKPCYIIIYLLPLSQFVLAIAMGSLKIFMLCVELCSFTFEVHGSNSTFIYNMSC